MRSFAYESRLNNLALGSGVCIYAYLGVSPCILELSLPSDGAGGIPGQGGTRYSGGAPMPLYLQHVCEFFTLPFCQRRQPSIRFLQTVAGCLTIAAFALFCPGD
jgi:hypothetical protein